MSIPVKFPGDKEIVFEQGKPVIILGANGSGKTRLSVKIEELNDKRFNNNVVLENEILVHRLTAQKSLTISDKITLADFDSSWRSLYYGETDQYATKNSRRFNSNPATVLLNDFDKALALLFAEDYKVLQEDQEINIEAEKNGGVRPPVIRTIRNKTIEIWNELLPQREIDLSRGGVCAQYNSDKYHGKEMSDGERVILYMICQALILPPNSIIIIDEPEQHIHKAIVKRLWDKLEIERNDCVFVYITHDLDFAASRNTDEVLWVKSFDGTDWEYEFLNTLEFEFLSEELLFEIIGTRTRILFVEGEKNSLDYALYNEFFKDKGYHLIPCGGCDEVVRVYKAKNVYEKLNRIEAHCLIDRDFRTEDEIAALEGDGVRFLKVAEVENLFVVPALLDIMGEHFGNTDAAEKAKDFIRELFIDTKSGQIGEAFIKEVNHQMSLYIIKDKKASLEDIQAQIQEDFSVSKIQDYFDKKQLIFDAAVKTDDILKIFNFKELSEKIGQKLGINNYPQRVINLLKSDQSDIREEILNALKPYIPDLP